MVQGTAPEQPLKRKRGRPRKEGGPAKPKPVVLDHTGQPRKRGRPRKYPLDTTAPPAAKPQNVSDDNLQKRGRGRPRKSDSLPPKPVAAPGPEQGPEATPRRGRPRKEHGAQPAEVVPDVAAQTVMQSKRGRGRPKKSEGTIMTEEATQPVKAPSAPGRGRPKKFSTATSGSANGVAQQSSASSASNPLAKMVVGSYELKCATVENEWPHVAVGMEMTILESEETYGLGFIAGFNLGIVEGTMLLAADKDSLERLYNKMSKGENRSLYGTFGSNENDGDDGDEGRTFKKRKTSAASSKRLYMFWRGRQTGEGEIYSGRNNGHLDFSESKKIVRFNGVGGFPAMGNECKFSGVKRSDEVSVPPQPWSDFSERAAAEASAARWR
ncbi:hypothetical protein D8B26_006097 [Coccidioides posadasii str. Silveira]|uniref:Uncharacterized protein n=3 Tax=Coccidioides posadasii TaxID=199306 RepID=E9DBP4_COCPS|nr:AT hook motif family protein [Coccidioides posadasii C735 delta SOWgp]EER27795.1 AT hook motif family protein [Coccidioides posadasii C735 delta SOWgp]EFW16196.1 conserved hypothetical protein [Coccidioides posadasii str. Silveira]QVM11449.1 hypothetical protein D8B26_006097 [Coccidioides posadasii str. Silveira]|eukprot:XP_003069940.1 AT hook motif family protein [Coccidioides posadasii C735 delta SOWgp]